MNSRRTVIIAAALALALVAAVFNVVYLKNADQRAYNNAKLVDVYVVSKEIPRGLDGASAISKEYIKLDQIPQKFRPGSAIAKGKLDEAIRGKVAINQLSVGQIVVDGQFVDQSVANTTTAQQVPNGQVAITVSVDQVHGVAGLLMPGDKVDVIVTGKQANSDNTFAQIMYQNVNIMAIGANTAPQAGTTATSAPADASAASGLITLAVPLDAATRIALVSGGGGNTSLYLALVHPDNQPDDSAPNYTSDNVLNGLSKTPYDNQ